MSSILSKKRKLYFKKLFKEPNVIGMHDSKSMCRGELGFLMEQIYKGHEELYLTRLANLLGIGERAFKKQYKIYLELLERQQAKGCCSKGVDKLRLFQWNYWGSIKQLNFGRCIVDALNKIHKTNLSAVWGSLLSPTGGLTGPGSLELISDDWNSPISLHACVHDAAGYLLKFHGVGPGYNYLDVISLFPRSSPLCCEIYGLIYWKKLCKYVVLINHVKG